MNAKLKDGIWRGFLVAFLGSALVLSFMIHYKDTAAKKQETVVLKRVEQNAATWELVENDTRQDGTVVQFYILPVTIKRNTSTDEVTVVLKQTVSKTSFMHSQVVEEGGMADMFCASGLFRLGYYTEATDHKHYILNWGGMQKVVAATPSQILENLLCSTQV